MRKARGWLLNPVADLGDGLECSAEVEPGVIVFVVVDPLGRYDASREALLVALAEQARGIVTSATVH
jgi:hypothetical protein